MRFPTRSRSCIVLFVVHAGLALTAQIAIAQQDIASPQDSSAESTAAVQSVAGITAILDHEKPDPKFANRLRAEADAEPRSGMGRGELAVFYYHRCQARGVLGESGKALADCQQGVATAEGVLSSQEFGRILQGLAIQYQSVGDPKNALEVYKRMLRPADEKGGGRGFNFTANRNIASIYISLGDFNQAEAYLRRNDALLQDARTWRNYAGFRRASWNADVEHGHAMLLEARGQFREAEAAYKRTEAFKREMVALRSTYEGGMPPPADQVQQGADQALVNLGRMKARQGRLAEGEADARRALLSRLKSGGKYNPRTAQYVGYVASMLVDQGRYAEAEKLTRTQLEIYTTLGLAKDSGNIANTLNSLASNLNLQRRWKEAAKVYDELDKAIAGWPAGRREGMSSSGSRIFTLYASNNFEAGIAAAERLIARSVARYGEQHMETAAARGMLAVGLAKAGRDADAMREFKLAIPRLSTESLASDLDDTTSIGNSTTSRGQRLVSIIEAYIGLLARSGGTDAAAESFRLADLIRGRAVQSALAASSARAVASNPALADLARKAQDLDKQIAAQLGALNSALGLPPEQRDAAALKTLQGDIDKLRAQRDGAKRDLANRFPQYSSLVEPQTPSVDDIRKVLRDDEAFLSFYFGRRVSFVWAVPKTGPVAFASLRIGAGAMEVRANALRKTLEPEGQYLSDIQPFDVAAAYELYETLLKPVEAAWRPAKSLIVVTNGALGLLPLSLLPIEPSPAITHDEPEPFSRYRSVAWLARSHAVTMVPSASSLRTLRQLPPGPAKREPMIGFGDPFFSKEQTGEKVEEVAALDPSTTTRGPPVRRRAAVKSSAVDKADFSRLPRLPDTAEELKSVALALSADPSQVLHLGKDANEKTVKGIDLSKFRIVAFATHGLVPGDLIGLTEPALALTAPDVADIDGDGLLTMSEVLALKLNADWVVLSACNTAAGAGAGAEAVSGLGRAFFYAGARTLLVTNWSVHSASARDLVTDLFRRQANDANLTRAEALRQAMLASMDGPGFRDAAGKTLFAYAHPMFWAPYSIIGDGGGSARPW
jgi:CHAT domain-containing protein